jgi:hypothetical protein
MEWLARLLRSFASGFGKQHSQEFKEAARGQMLFFQ